MGSLATVLSSVLAEMPGKKAAERLKCSLAVLGVVVRSLRSFQTCHRQYVGFDV